MKRFLFLSLVLFGVKEVQAANTVQSISIPTSIGVSSAPAVSNAPATVTISTPVAPGLSTGWSNYITNIHIESLMTGGVVGAVNPVTCTSTNMQGSPAWNFPPAVSTGTITIMDMQYANPLTPTTAQANTTVTCPAATGIRWNVNVNYFAAP